MVSSQSLRNSQHIRLRLESARRDSQRYYLSENKKPKTSGVLEEGQQKKLYSINLLFMSKKAWPLKKILERSL